MSDEHLRAVRWLWAGFIAFACCALVALALSACSAYTQPHPGVEVECRVADCLRESQAACISEHFGHLFPTWQARDPLHVIHADAREVARLCARAVVACAPDAETIVTSTVDALDHEMVHVHAWRTDGTGDQRHRDEYALARVAREGCT